MAKFNDTVLDYYADEQEFREVLAEACRMATTSREEEFVASLQAKFIDWGKKMYLSDAQYGWLERIIHNQE